MTLTIDFSPALANDVRQQAARRGQKVNDFVVRAVEAQLAQALTGDASEEAASAATEHARRGFSADEVIALLKIPQPVPDDAQCQQILEEELLRKHVLS